MANPKVSVVLPVYNKGSYLEQCLDSLCNQSLADIELVCVNDGSTDNSKAVLNKYAVKDNRIKIIDTPNNGAGCARNTGLEATSGEYVIFLDSDDFFEKNMLEEMSVKADEKMADITICGAIAYDTTLGRDVGENWWLNVDAFKSDVINPYKDDNTLSITESCIWNKLYRREFLMHEDLQFQNMPNNNDTAFALLSLCFAKSVTYVNKVFIHYRCSGGDNSITAKRNMHMQCSIKAFDHIISTLIGRGIYDIFAYGIMRQLSKTALYELSFCTDEDQGRRYIDAVTRRLSGRERYMVQNYYKENNNLGPESINPKISVITVSLNSADTIERTIRSVLRQNYDNIEYIIIDGGSTDGTVEIIKKYERQISYWISEPDEGLYYAMNKGLGVASGDYVIFINSDDYLNWDAFYRAEPYLKKSGADVVYGNIIGMKENKPDENIHPWPLESLRWCVPFCHQAVFMKRQPGVFFDTTFRIAADYNMLFEMYMNGAKFVYMPYGISHFSLNGLSSNYYQTNIDILDIACRIMNKYEKKKYIYRPRLEKHFVRIENRHQFDEGQNYDRIADYVRQRLGGYDRSIVFGTGDILERFWEIIEKAGITISYFIDNNQEKQGNTIHGIEIRRPEELRNESDCLVFIMTDKFVDEMLDQLESMELNESISILNFVQIKEEYDNLTKDEIIEYFRETLPSYKEFMDVD